MTADLLPCPFCGGKNMRYEPTEQSIFCIRCGATGPYKHFPYSPDEIWNTRHEPDELPEWAKIEIEKIILEANKKTKGGSAVVNPCERYGMVLLGKIFTIRKPE